MKTGFLWKANVTRMVALCLFFLTLEGLVCGCAKQFISASAQNGTDYSIIVPNMLKAGPWLVWDGVPGNMYIRMVLRRPNQNTSVHSGTVTVNGKDFTMSIIEKGTNQTAGFCSEEYGWALLEAHCTGLPNDTVVNYSISNPAFNGQVVKASFRTAPAPGDQGKLVFHVFADNRRLYGSSLDFLPKVESRMVVQEIGPQDKSHSLVIHAGDYTVLGQKMDECDPLTLWRKYGWANEFLKSSNENTDWTRHTWLRATVPTIGCAGNHEGKNLIGDTSYTPDDFTLYDLLMGDHLNYNQDKYFISYNGQNYPAAAKFDWGSLRVITLNTYDIMTEDDSYGALAWLKKMVDNRKGLPTILVMHPPMYIRKVDTSIGETGSFWNSQLVLEGVLPPVIRHKVSMVIQGHVHATTRTLVKAGVTYYIMGGGGAPDLDQAGSSKGDLSVTTNVAQLTPYGQTWFTGPKKKTQGLAWARVEVDYDSKTITTKIYNLDHTLIDKNEISF